MSARQADREEGAIGSRTRGVVLAYRPDRAVLANITALAGQVAHVYVVNNSPDEQTEEMLAGLRESDTVTVLDQIGNVGVAAGFNAGMRAAMDAGADYIWIFDQDSTVTDGALLRLGAALAAHPGAGIAGPALRSGTTGRIYARESGDEPKVVPTLISSGALFDRRALDRIGLHDERLFIDYVDHDICLRAARSGYQSIKVFDAVIVHHFGSAVARRFLGRTIYLADYSPMRHYYSTRNRMVMVRRYGLGLWFWEDLWFTAKATVKLVLFESNRSQKLGASVKGFIAAMGRSFRSGRR